MPRKRTPKVDLDAHWKRIAERLPRRFLHFFLPSLHAQSDPAKPIRSASKELQKIFPQASKEGRRYPDLLLDVPLLDGDEAFVIAHVEVEGSGEDDMPERMFNYLNPLWNKFPRRIVALVIYTGRYVPTKFDTYTYERFGTEIAYKFNSYQVREQKEAELLKSDNPFALVILACWYCIEHAGKKKLRYLLECKKKLAELCLERNYSPDELTELLTFVVWVIHLPEVEKSEFEDTLHELINQHMETRPLILDDKGSGDLILRLVLGKTSDDIDAMVRQARAEAKAHAEAEAKMELEALIKNYVWQLHLHGDKPEEIARITQKSLAFVKTTLREMKKSNQNGGVAN